MGWITRVSEREDGVWRRKHNQAMRTECVRVEGSRWNRPCPLGEVCEGHTYCVCNLPRIRRLRSRGCNRVACCFLKWCRSIPSRAEQPPPWRMKAALLGAGARLRRYFSGGLAL